MKILTFFDLENTLINHWTDVTLCHQDRISKIIKDIEIEGSVTYGIYSYALWCKENVDITKHGNINTLIENFYKITIESKYILSVDEMCKFSEKSHQQSIPLSPQLYWKYYPKTHAFIDLVISGEFNMYDTIILVDDTVIDGMEINVINNSPKIKFYNPIK